MKYLKSFGLFLFFALPSLLIAQEQLGLKQENYAGVNSLLLNPANNLSSKFTWDVNLAAAGVFFENSYAYIGQTNLIELSKRAEEVRAISEFESRSAVPPGTLLLDFFDNNQAKHLALSAEVMGPSVMVNLASGHTFGIFTRARTMLSVPNIPAGLGYYQFENLPLETNINIDPFTTTGMSWSEIGINYGKEFLTASGYMGFGINIKFLNGYEAFYLKNNIPMTATRHPGDSIAFSGVDLEYGFTTAAIDAEAFNLQKNGSGIGFDLGATMTIDDSGEDYKLKLGASILDIGKINFNNNVENHLLQYDEMTGLDPNLLSAATNIEESTELLSELILGDATQSSAIGNFGIWLPTALSIQADYQIVPMVYANATLVQHIPMPGPGLRRSDILALSPRIEHRWFSMSTPLVLYNWQDFRIGTSVRLAFLTLGTDNIGSILGKSNFTGTDFYLALKVNPFKLKFGGGGGRGKGGKNVKCYSF